jgi:hypothetical protein
MRGSGVVSPAPESGKSDLENMIRAGCDRLDGPGVSVVDAVDE